VRRKADPSGKMPKKMVPRDDRKKEDLLRGRDLEGRCTEATLKKKVEHDIGEIGNIHCAM